MSNIGPEDAASLSPSADTSSLESTLDDVSVDEDRAAAENQGFDHDQQTGDSPPRD